MENKVISGSDRLKEYRAKSKGTYDEKEKEESGKEESGKSDEGVQEGEAS